MASPSSISAPPKLLLVLCASSGPAVDEKMKRVISTESNPWVHPLGDFEYPTSRRDTQRCMNNPGFWGQWRSDLGHGVAAIDSPASERMTSVGTILTHPGRV